MNPKVDNYLAEGCGRCAFVGTPQCKVNTWREELVRLRTIVLSSGLTEELKWSQPCYTFQNSNILMVTAFREYAVISFFKGALLKDEAGILHKPGENSQATRMIRVTSVGEIEKLEPQIKAYIFEALEVEKAGLKVDFKAKTKLVYPEELQSIFNEMPALKTAFEELTPGRQRGYLLYFSQPKQSLTRESRIKKYIPQILGGKGLND